MKRVLSTHLFLSLLLLASPSRELSAQLFGNLGSAAPGEDAVSVGLLFGVMSPQTKFRDGGSFDSSTLLGVTTSFWVSRNLGVQASLGSSKHEGLPASDGGVSIVSNRDPSILTVMVDGVARYPVTTDGAVALSPYVGLGGGWKSYDWAFDPLGGPDARGFDLAWSWSVGVDLRFGVDRRLGVRGEYRDLRTPMERWGEDLTHHDRVLTAGLLLNF